MQSVQAGAGEKAQFGQRWPSVGDVGRKFCPPPGSGVPGHNIQSPRQRPRRPTGTNNARADHGECVDAAGPHLFLRSSRKGNTATQLVPRLWNLFRASPRRPRSRSSPLRQAEFFPCLVRPEHAASHQLDDPARPAPPVAHWMRIRRVPDTGCLPDPRAHGRRAVPIGPRTASDCGLWQRLSSWLGAAEDPPMS